MVKLVIKKQCAFALAELLIVLALLGMVLGLGYMYFDFGATTFAGGERRSIAQQSIRLGADFITSEIRYANQLTINPVSMQAGFHYIYQQGNSVIYRNRSGAERILLDGRADRIAYSVSFAEESAVGGIDFTLVLLFTLAADVNLYSLDTSVHILNLVDASKYTGLSDGSTVATVIQYKKPWEN